MISWTKIDAGSLALDHFNVESQQQRFQKHQGLTSSMLRRSKRGATGAGELVAGAEVGAALLAAAGEALSDREAAEREGCSEAVPGSALLGSLSEVLPPSCACSSFMKG